jgi:hypothetical protein
VHGCVVIGQRYRLPRGSDGVEQLHVEAISAGWCELSDVAPIPRLPFGRVRIGHRGRFRLPDAPGYGQRWACSVDEPILVLGCRDPATGGHRILLIAVRHIVAGLDALRPALHSGRLRSGGAATAPEDRRCDGAPASALRAPRMSLRGSHGH